MNISMKSLLVGGTCALCFSFAGQAQSVDYSALQDTFGEPVTTSATGKPQRASDVPADMEIITSDEIRRMGAHSIPDVLQFVTGMDVRQYTASNSEANVRGEIQTTTPRLLVLVNGRQVYLDYYGYVPWSSIPVQMSEIRQIEVVKGPASALFGFNAYSGVINIITNSPLKDNVSTVEGEYGTQAYRHGSAVLTHHFFGDTLGVKLAAGYSKNHEFGTGNPQDMQRTAEFEARWQMLSNVEIGLEATRAETSDFELSSLNTFGNIQYGISSIKGDVLADTSLGLLSAEGHTSHANIKKHFSFGDLIYSDNLLQGKASDLFKIGTDNTFRVSVEYRDTSNNVPSLGLPMSSRIGYTVLSGSAMWDWQISPKWSLTNSLRFDHLVTYWDGQFATYPVGLKGTPPTLADYNNHTIDAVSYNSGLVYKMSDVDTFRLLAGHGVQVPSLLDLSNLGTGATVGAAPYSLYLKPSYQDNYEIGYDRKLAEINSTLHLAVFHKVSTNLLQYAKVNSGSSIETGFELGLKGQSASGLRWNGSYTYRSVSDHVGIAAGTGTNLIDFQNGTPKSKVVAGLGYNFKKFEIDLQGRWQSSYVDWYNINYAMAVHPTTIKAYPVLDARVAYNFTPGLSLAVSGTAVTKTQQVETGGLPVERRLYVTVAESF